jgi:hypothetical protein
MVQAQELLANLQQSETRYAGLLAKLEESETLFADLPVAVALRYFADFDAVATNPRAAEKFDAHVQEQVSSALGILKTAGKNFAHLKLSESRDSRSKSMELTTLNFCSASYLSSARQCDCGGSAEKSDKGRRRQRHSHPCSAFARACRNGQ